jgi:hypothetical protein
MQNNSGRNPAMLRINQQQQGYSNPAVPNASPIKGKVLSKDEARSKMVSKYTGRPPEEISLDSMTPTQLRQHMEDIAREVEEKKRREEAEKLVDWDAALAQLQLSDSEDLTSSAFRFAQIRVHGENAFPDSPMISGKEFNKVNPPDPKYREEEIDPDKKYTEQQQNLILKHREDRRKLIDRTKKAKENPVQLSVDLFATLIGGATAGDVALAMFAPQVEMGIIGARTAPFLAQRAAKAMQGLRNTKGLKGDILANIIENLMMETMAIPMENIAKKDFGEEQMDAGDITARITLGMLFQAGFTTLVHVVKNSAFWRNLFETDPEKAAKLFKEQSNMIKEGIPFDEQTLLDSWGKMSPEDRVKWAKDQTEIDNYNPKEVPDLDTIEDSFNDHMNELLEMDYEDELAKFEAKGDTEGVEAPKKETTKDVDKLHEEANRKFKEQARALIDCIRG